MITCLWKPLNSCPKKAIEILLKTMIMAVNGVTTMELYIPDDLPNFHKSILNVHPISRCESHHIRIWIKDINICIFRTIRPLQENSLRRILKVTTYCIGKTRPSNCHIQRYSELEKISNEVFENIRNILTENSSYSNLISNDRGDIIEDIRRQEGKNFLSDEIGYYHLPKKSTINKIKYKYSNKFFEDVRMNKITRNRLSKETNKCFLNTDMEMMKNCTYDMYLYSIGLEISKQEHLKQTFLDVKECFRDHFKYCQDWIADKVIKIHAEIIRVTIPSDFLSSPITFQNGYITCPSLLNQNI
nr:uncharacterized protein LOC122269006 [Parasteatoda tepidariorum]